ncbi:hypothetical protein H4R21_001902, partial [Coemansia helicoidea]
PAKRKSLAEMRSARRERQRVAQEGSAETQDDARQYLETWDQRRAEWKFNKAKQLWLVRHLYVEAKVPPAVFDIAERYLGSTKGQLRETLLRDARLIANPAAAATDEQQTLRTKALGLMPSHVSKSTATAARKARQDAKRAALAAAEGKGDGDDGGAGDAEAAEASAESPDVEAELPSGARDRAQRIIAALTQPAPEPPKSTPSTKKPKRARAADSSSSDSDEEPRAKKSKKDKADKASKKDKSDRKSKAGKKSKSKADKKDKSDKKDKKDGSDKKEKASKKSKKVKSK